MGARLLLERDRADARKTSGRDESETRGVDEYHFLFERGVPFFSRFPPWSSPGAAE